MIRAKQDAQAAAEEIGVWFLLIVEAASIAVL